MKLYCNRSDPKAAKILTLLQIIGESVQIIYIETLSTDLIQDFLQLSPTGKSPVLDNGLEVLKEPNTILRNIASRCADRGLLGVLDQERAKIDELVEYSSTTLDPIIEELIKDPNNLYSRQNLVEELISLQGVVRDKTYLVGFGMTLADIAIATSLLCPFREIYQEIFSRDLRFLSLWLKEMNLRLSLDKLPPSFLNFQRQNESQEVLSRRKFQNTTSSLLSRSNYRYADFNANLPISNSTMIFGRQGLTYETIKQDEECIQEGTDGENDDSKSKKEKKSKKNKKKKKDKKKKSKRSKSSSSNSSSSSKSSSSSNSSSSSSSSSSSVSKDKKKYMKQIKEKTEKVAKELKKLKKIMKKMRFSSSFSESDSGSSSSKNDKKKKKSKKSKKNKKNKNDEENVDEEADLLKMKNEQKQEQEMFMRELKEDEERKRRLIQKELEKQKLKNKKLLKLNLEVI